MLKKVLVLAVFLAVLPVASAQDIGGLSEGQMIFSPEIQNPEAVSYLHAEVTRSGSVYLFDNSPLQTARELTVTLTVPQNTSRQRAFIKSMDGADRYSVAEDRWGNKVVRLHWEVPELKKRIYYKLVADVEVSDGEESPGGKFQETDLTKPNTEIAKTAYELTYGLDDMQRFFRLTEWIYRNMRYDNNAKSFTESAAWTYKNRRGTCDEFSNLLVSMLRLLGYSPRYVVGYAYSENWGQHGWVEVDYQGKALSLDPTWLESPVDSTHIKVAELPDSNLTENVEVRGGQITIDWNKDEPEIKVVSHRESPKMTIAARLMPENSTGGSYSLLETDFTNPGCLLTNVNAKSCVMSGGEGFLSISQKSQALAFCGSKRIYWFLRSPAVERGMVYTCPVIVYGAGAEKTVTAGVEPDSRKGLATKASSQNVFTPGQSFEVETVTENTGHETESVSVYLFFKDYVQSRNFQLSPGQSASIKWTLKAPASPGTHEFTVFSSSGELMTRNITVVSQRHAQIENISAPGKGSANETVWINITLKALANFSGSIRILTGEHAQERNVSMEPYESQTIRFAYVPESPGTKSVSVAVFSEGQYEDGWWGTLEIRNQKQWWDFLLEWIEGIADTIARALSGK
ncbi:MAG TPA: transglutaminase-like domain-containing protein [archaeon]|nr:transglutaminase-like domain-containing protein [archaeon]